MSRSPAEERFRRLHIGQSGYVRHDETTGVISISTSMFMTRATEGGRLEFQPETRSIRLVAWEGLERIEGPYRHISWWLDLLCITPEEIQQALRQQEQAEE